VPRRGHRYGDDHLLAGFTQETAVGRSSGSPYRDRLVTWTDRCRIGMSRSASG
jgi:hypothetical protein